jgi:hypothetical protein
VIDSIQCPFGIIVIKTTSGATFKFEEGKLWQVA